MAKRYSMLSGRIEEIPDAPAKSAAPDLSAQIADLRVQLATAQAQLEAARAECASLAGGQFRRDGRLDIRLPPPVEVEPDDEEIAAILAMIMPILQGES